MKVTASQTRILMAPAKGRVQSKKKKSVENSTLGGGVSPRSFSTLFLKCVEWSNSSRNAKKNFSVLGGVGGGYPSALN